ncbi:thiol:disulfide interchange protein DsbD [Prosthecobacter fusiformis]|uniref:Thiol:disulfide interchange protein DsbD n=1 Tax=Prosthecobacter fusiformis TaxID=48464 RepID=A0A4R7RM36_9BACT|nr:thioredoxin family protein [Prosthecobacter fusiformis]TDU64553.1 thiol:disulfide interchange protein DsbD [Prosthecobacter fusiformis]
MLHPTLRFLLSLLLLTAVSSPLSAQLDLASGTTGAASAKVTASLVSELKVAEPGKPFRIAVKLDHQPHWHTYGKVLPADVIGKPTSLKWTLPEGWTVEEMPWPDTHEVPSTDGKTSEGYDGIVYLPAKITPVANAEGTAEIIVKVDALVCDPQNCMPAKPEARISLTLAEKAETDPSVTEIFSQIPSIESSSLIKPANAPAKPAVTSFLSGLFIAFIGGLILNIMPCVFPVLGIKIMSVVQQAGEDKRQVLLHGLAYTLGILICFWALGGLVISLGKAWGFQLQSPGFVYGLCAFFLIFGLNMAGLFEIGASAVGVGANLQSKHGLSGSFFSGLLATVVATPCSAPFLGSALGYTLTLPPAQAMLMYTMIGIGLASPFLVLSLFPKLVSALPRPGAWMESFKQAMSFLLFGTVAFLAWVLTGMIEGQPMLFTLFSLVIIALGCWIYGRWSLPHKPARTRTIAVVLTLVSIGGGLAFGWPQVEKGPVNAGAHVEGGLTWEAWSPEKVAELRAANKAVYIDYTAKWCFTCQVNKRVYKDTSLQKLITDKKVVLLKADWTNEDPRITKALSELGKAAVPVNVLYTPNQSEPLILPELLSVDNVSAAFQGL